jgi:MATE family multidrug resistance protein
MEHQAEKAQMRTEFRATLALALPLVVANLLQMAIYAVDVIFIARLGEVPLAASSLAVAVFASMMWGFHGLCGGAAPLIGAELGHRKHAVREVRRSVRMALWHAALCAVAGAGVCLLAEPLMRATGQDARISALAGSFIMILAVSIFPQLLRACCAPMFQPLGDRCSQPPSPRLPLPSMR